MKRGRLSLVIAAVAVPALGLGLGFGLGGTASASPAAPARTSMFSEQTVVVNCLSKPQVRPGSFTLACADGIKQLFLACQAADVPLAQSLRTEPWQAKTFIVKDPDGNLILFAGPAS